MPLSLTIASVLFPMQIAYKLLSLLTVGWGNPVVKSNVTIAGLHAVTVKTLH